MAANQRQRQRAADALRSGATQLAAAQAAGVGVSTLKRWLTQPSFQASIVSSSQIRPGSPPRVDGAGEVVPQENLQSQMWVTATAPEALGRLIHPAAHETADAVLHVHLVEQGAVESVRAAIDAGEYPAESPYIPVPLAGLNGVLDNLPLICRLASRDHYVSLMAWLDVWTFVDEEGCTRRLGEALWPGQRSFMEALLEGGHVVSIKGRKVGLSTLACAHAAWTAQIRDVNAIVDVISYRTDAAQGMLHGLRRGFDGLPPFLRLPKVRETSTLLTYAAGANDVRSVKAFPATPNSAIEVTASHLVLDEWAHTFDPEALWQAVEPTLSPRGTSALITTPRSSDDFVAEYWRRSEKGETRHEPVFVSALERPDRSEPWLMKKRAQEGKVRASRNYPRTAEEAFTHAADPYFQSELLKTAQRDALRPGATGTRDLYIKGWDPGRKDPSVCVVLRAPSRPAPTVWHVVGYERLLATDYPTLQHAIEDLHAAFPGPTVVESNSVGEAIIQNLSLPASEVISHFTSETAKQRMLTEIELLLQEQNLKIHSDFGQLLTELANYRLPDKGIIQDSVIALGLAVSNRYQVGSFAPSSAIDRRLFHALNSTAAGPTPPEEWLDRQKLTSDGPSQGLVRIVREPTDSRVVEKLEEYSADALSGELAQSLASGQGWRVKDPAALERLGLDDNGRRIER